MSTKFTLSSDGGGAWCPLPQAPTGLWGVRRTPSALRPALFLLAYYGLNINCTLHHPAPDPLAVAQIRKEFYVSRNSDLALPTAGEEWGEGRARALHAG
eukprot:scaffold118183_cov25-Tisochrysis_lutea.AAC.1